MVSNLKQWALPIATFFLASFAIYSVSLEFYFLVPSDDTVYIFRNPYLHEISWANTIAIFSNLFFGDYLPLNLLSYSWDFTWWGFDPFGYHLTQVILHASNACLLFAVLRLLQVPERAAWFSVLIFVVHPIHVESVVWISERKNLLSSLFILLSTWFYLQHATSLRFRRSQYYLCLLSFILALFSKSISVMLPCIFVLLDFFVLKRQWRVMEKIPFFLLSILVGLATMGSLDAVVGENVDAGRGFSTALFYAIRVCWDYAVSLVFPFQLSPLYYSQSLSLVDVQAFLAYLIFVGICFYVVKNFRSKPYVMFAIGWFVVWLLPVSNIIPIPVFRQDRYLYLPSMSVIVGVAIGLENWGRRQPFKVNAMMVGALFFLASLSFLSSFFYASGHAYWHRVARQNPLTAYAQVAAGDQCAKIENIICAEKYYRRALVIDPEHAYALNNMGALLVDLKRYEEARAILKKAIQVSPTNAMAYRNRIVLAKRSGLGKEEIPAWIEKFNRFNLTGKKKDIFLGEFRFSKE